MNARLFRFVRIPRLRRLYRCPECELATDKPAEHARTHLPGWRPGNPGRPEGESIHEVIIEPDLPTVDQIMATAGPLHGIPVMDAEAMAADLAEAIRLTHEHLGETAMPSLPGYSWFDALERYYTHRPAARPRPPQSMDSMLRKHREPLPSVGP